MGNLRKQPITNITFNNLKPGNGVNIICASMQGWRQYMEDYNTIVSIGETNVLAGVFDGHGGHEVASFISSTISKQLMNQPFYRMKNYGRALTNCFKRLDQMIDSSRGEQALLNLHKKMHPTAPLPTNPIKLTTGSTANVVLLTPDTIYNANLGDTRSVLCSNGTAIPLSQDHKPNNPKQKARILKAGGTIHHNRINGSINISRTFGDFNYKIKQQVPYDEQMIICVPEIKQLARNKMEDQYIVIASDGVWQKFGNNYQQFVDQINGYFAKFSDWNEALKEFMHSLVPGNVHEKCGYDNMTVLLVLLNCRSSDRNSITESS